MDITLLRFTQNSEEVIEQAARKSHESNNKLGSNPNFLSKVIKLGHLSILEHAHATFDINNISRACSHQFVRHRHLSFTQKSQRYVDEDSFKYITPRSLDKNKNYIDLMQKIKCNYHTMRVNDKVLKQDVRFILPNACSTSMIVSGNFRSWFEFIQKRLDKSAQWEIRELAKNVFNNLKSHAPNVFNIDNLESVIKYNLDDC